MRIGDRTARSEELERTYGGEGLPIEAAQQRAARQGEAGMALVEAVSGYDLAQFELFVAIGQTPHGALPDPSRPHRPPRCELAGKRQK